MQEEELIYCPNCGLQQLSEGVNCVKCKINIFSFKTTFLMVCPECKTIRQANYCVNCGSTLIAHSEYPAHKTKRKLFLSAKWLGVGGAAVLFGFLFFFNTPTKKISTGKPRGIERNKILEDAEETNIEETYQETHTPSPPPQEASHETIEYSDADIQQAEDWLNRFIPILKTKGLIARTEDTGIYTIFVSDEWAVLSEMNKSKIIENTSFALKVYGKNTHVNIKAESGGEVLAKNGDDGIVFFQ